MMEQHGPMKTVRFYSTEYTSREIQLLIDCISEVRKETIKNQKRNRSHDTVILLTQIMGMLTDYRILKTELEAKGNDSA